MQTTVGVENLEKTHHSKWETDEKKKVKLTFRQTNLSESGTTMTNHNISEKQAQWHNGQTLKQTMTMTWQLCCAWKASWGPSLPSMTLRLPFGHDAVIFYCSSSSKLKQLGKFSQEPKLFPCRTKAGACSNRMAQTKSYHTSLLTVAASAVVN